MKRLDEDKVSLVEFLRSINYGRRVRSTGHGHCATHFAGLSPHARAKQKTNPEELSLVRSDN